MAGSDIVVAPGVYDGLSARLAARAGFAAVYATGGGIARSMGYPDLGLISMTEMVARIAGIVERAGVPVIADADTGYGNALNARRAVRELERAGVAALHLEDQVFPKRCGHYDDKAVVPVAEMAQKLRAARDAATDPDLVLIARTDALAVEGLDAAIERALAYGEAGADVIFIEAPTRTPRSRRLPSVSPSPSSSTCSRAARPARPTRPPRRPRVPHRDHPVGPAAGGDPRDGRHAGRDSPRRQ